MVARTHRRWRTVLAVGFMALLALHLVFQRNGWLMPLLFGCLALYWAVLVLKAWRVPLFILSEAGIERPGRPLLPWELVEAVNFGGGAPWPSASKIVLLSGEQLTFPTADRSQFANGRALIPEHVMIRPSAESSDGV